VFLIVLVLMQKSRDQGVGAAFGSGVTETVFGAGTTTALVRLTIYCAIGLLATTLLLAMLHARRGPTAGTVGDKLRGQTPAPSASGGGVSRPPALPVAEPRADLAVPAADTKPAPAPAPETKPEPVPPTPAPAEKTP